jgi:hypothetical protein
MGRNKAQSGAIEPTCAKRASSYWCTGSQMVSPSRGMMASTIAWKYADSKYAWRRNGSSSVGKWWPSTYLLGQAIREATSGHQWPLRFSQRSSSEAISGHQGQSLVIRRHQGPSRTGASELPRARSSRRRRPFGADGPPTPPEQLRGVLRAPCWAQVRAPTSLRRRAICRRRSAHFG